MFQRASALMCMCAEEIFAVIFVCLSANVFEGSVLSELEFVRKVSLSLSGMFFHRQSNTSSG